MPPSPICATRASPPRQCGPISTSSICRGTTCSSTSRGCGRLAIDALAAMSDEELTAAVGAPLESARALRGARTLVEAREIARQIEAPRTVSLGARGAADAGAVPRAARRSGRSARRGGRAGDPARAEGGRRRPEGAPPRAHRRRAWAGAVDGGRRAAGGGGRGARHASACEPPGRADAARHEQAPIRSASCASTTRSRATLVELPPPPEPIGMYVVRTDRLPAGIHIGNAGRS